MNLLDLFVKISVDTGDVDKGFSETSSKAETLAGKLKGNLATAAKVGAAAVTAAATGVAALTKASIDQYAEYEQLVGGAQLMFGDAYAYIADKAKNAYSTVQMSQNDYLQQVNGFATGLKTALGGNEQAAAELADRIVNAEADVVAATGNSQEAVQNAFNGIMKSNYTMLDNLQIGITPTKEGFQEVIDKVNEWNAANGRATEYQIENLADCQSALVDYIEMVGMQGYASSEAADTIQGSVASMKGAWSNLITGIASDNADLDTLIGNFVSSVETAAGNIIPRVTRILSGMGAAIQKIAPILAAEIPALISSSLPALVSAGAQLLVGLITGLISALPELAAAVPQIVTEVYNSFVAAGPQLLEAGSQLLEILANGVIQGIPAMIERLPQVIVGILNFISNNLPKIASAGAEILIKLTMGIISTIPSLVSQLPQIIIAIVNGISALMGSVVNIGKEIVKGLWQGIQNMAGWIKDKVTGFFSGIVNGVKNFLGIHSPSKVFAGIGGFMAEGLGDGFGDKFASVKKDIESSMRFDATEVGITANAYIGEYSGASSRLGKDDSIHLTVVAPNGKELARFVAPHMGTQLQLVRG
jgi:phage-related protein